MIAVEPSDVMAAQRPRQLAPALRGDAARLPLRDGSVDAAMAILTVHHWDPDTEKGVRELRRVARGPVVIVTFDSEVSEQLWMIRDYLPEVAEQDRHDFPSLEQLGHWLGPGTLGSSRSLSSATRRTGPLRPCGRIPSEPSIPRSRRAPRGSRGSRRPSERGPPPRLERDLATGEWDRRHGHLRSLDRLDAGQRLLVHHP